MMNKICLCIAFLLVILSGCKKSPTEPDTQAPTVALLFPLNGAELTTDTTYTILADVKDNKGVVRVDFYIDNKKAASVYSPPFQYSLNGAGNPGEHVIMVNAVDDAGNIGSSIVKVIVLGRPGIPSNPVPANTATDIATSPTLSWFCSDPDAGMLAYDVFLDTNNPPTTLVSRSKSADVLSRSGLSNGTTYYWRVIAENNKGITTTGNVWSFTTSFPPLLSPLFPVDGASGVFAFPALSWDCSDPQGHAITYDVFLGTSNPPIPQVAIGQSGKTLSCSGLSNQLKYYWRVNAQNSQGAKTIGPVWSFTPDGLIEELIAVPGGAYMMGTELLIIQWFPHPVTVGSFSIDRFEITYERWGVERDWGQIHGYTDLAVGENGHLPAGVANPVSSVSWYDVVKWCNARSEKAGLTPVYYTDSTCSMVYRTGAIDLPVNAVKWTANGFRLPTEAEWEFAARGGTQTRGYYYSGSNTVDLVAWWWENSINAPNYLDVYTHSVGQKLPNELGLFDMSGNVEEWCWDWYADYTKIAEIDPTGPSSGIGRIARGGSVVRKPIMGPSVYVRGKPAPSDSYSLRGFRCVKR